MLKVEHLVGRPYIHGVDHCYKLVRDFYLDNFGIVMGNWAMPSDWKADELNLIEMIYEREGFFKVEDWSIKNLHPGDLLCMAVRSSNPNHFAINIGGNEVLHHPLAQMSTIVPLRDYFRMSTCFVLRHLDVPDLRPVGEVKTIQELVDARNLHIA